MSDRPETIPAFIERARARHGSRPILFDRQGQVTYDEMCARAAAAAEGLRNLGVKPGDRIGLIADNSRDWIVADLAIQIVRAISVPRGTDSPVEDISFLFQHAEVGIALAHDGKQAKILEAIRSEVPSLGEIVSIAAKDAPGRTLDDLVAAGEGAAPFGEQAAAVKPDDIATIIYTSGTTGRPKGVVLTQANFAHQARVIPPLFHMGPEEKFLSILPPWHSFERTVEYAALSAGCRIAYTNRRRFRDDLRKQKPTFVPSVPRLWEMVHDGIYKKVDEGSGLKRGLFKGARAIAAAHVWGRDRLRGHLLQVKKPSGLGWVGEGLVRGFAGLTALVTLPFDRLAQAVVFKPIKAATGGQLRGGISGGGLMPPHVDQFFRTVGVPILVGYGLTETSPVISVRRPERNVLGTIGTAIEEVEVAVRDLDTGEMLPTGKVGIIYTRGPHVMQGYHEAPELTREVIDADGWFNTGDLGFLTDAGDICFHGRAKETIVLAGGENVEPSHVESAILTSPLVEQVVVVGQDRKTLAALVLPQVEPLAKALGLDQGTATAELASNDDVRDFLRRELIKRTAPLAPFERVKLVSVLPQAFDISDGTLTQTLKLKRHVIRERYALLIERAYER